METLNAFIQLEIINELTSLLLICCCRRFTYRPPGETCMGARRDSWFLRLHPLLPTGGTTFYYGVS